MRGIETQTAYNLTAAGAAYGTAKSGIGIAGVGTFRSDLIMKVGNDGYTKCTSG
jgi:hypothetical protein